VARTLRLLLPALFVCLLAGTLAPLAQAASTQVSIFEQDGLLLSDPTDTLATLKALGVDVVRVDIAWNSLTPDSHSGHPPAGFHASNPASYPAAKWAPYDALVQAASADGIKVLFTLNGGVPLWAQGAGRPRNLIFDVWRPKPPDFGAFVRAVGTRYSGRYTPPGASAPLPAVSMWSVWNEPNYGYSLGPQTTDHGYIDLAASEYRSLANQAWSNLTATGHRGNTILIGEVAPHGSFSSGQFGGTAPLAFIRSLYCVNRAYRQLRGSLAHANGCPTTAAGSRAFRGENPGLFRVSGFSAHLYERHTPPDQLFNDHCTNGQDLADYADMATVPKLESTLNTLQRVYGSHLRPRIYNTEFGYQTDPPQVYSCKIDSLPVSPRVASYYMNWAEYLSYKNPQMASYDQYLLRDSYDRRWATGLELPDGRPQPMYGAFRTPLYLPQTKARRPTSLLVWGGARPAAVDGVSSVQIQFQAHDRGPWVTLRTVGITNPRGYIDVRQRFAASGLVRLAWTDPLSGTTYFSRYVQVTIG
jgi:hypothetical protein